MLVINISDLHVALHISPFKRKERSFENGVGTSENNAFALA